MKRSKSSSRAMRKHKGVIAEKKGNSRYAQKRRHASSMMYGPGCCAHPASARRSA